MGVGGGEGLGGSIYFVQFGTTLTFSFDNFCSPHLCEGGGVMVGRGVGFQKFKSYH